jgi:hypothetical protein
MRSAYSCGSKNLQMGDAMGEWEFYRIPGFGTDDAPFHWSWRCRQDDGGVTEASETFRFFLDCVAHARLHGYKNGPLMTRRDTPFPAPTRRHAAAALG